jgi:hypothetical protein
LKEQNEESSAGQGCAGDSRNAERNLIIEFDVINETIALRNQHQQVAS